MTPPSATPLPSAAIRAGTKDSSLKTFLDLIKFSHSIFAMPFALVAMFLAGQATGHPMPGLLQWILIIGCMVSARTFGMTFNRLVDRKFDAGNPRTRNRPSVTGALSVRWMTTALFVAGAVFIALTTAFWWLLHNPWPAILALPVLGFIALYSYTKRFTWLCHFVIGASLGLAPLSTWVALVPPHGALITIQIGWLAIAVTTWTAGFDLLYAMQDIAIDRRDRLHSLPARFGPRAALIISRMCHLVTLFSLAAFGAALGGGIRLGVVYWLGWIIVAILLAVEQSLVKPDDISRINLAFMTINGIVGLVFGLLSITAILLA
jgi:4-hydroxybenzoate polyprenyltransferase